MGPHSADMWDHLKQGWHRFRNAKPGERFMKAHDHQQSARSGSASSILMIVLGSLFILGGLFLGLIPGVPGIVLAVVGLALIATRFRRLAEWLDRGEVGLRNLVNKLKSALRRH